MKKRLIVIALSAFAILLIVYLDMAFWTLFGPTSEYQLFPVINLVVIPMAVIIIAVLWGRLPGKE